MHVSTIKCTICKSFFAAAHVLCNSLLASGCDPKGNFNESSDVAAFHQLVELDLPAKSVRWEVFGTPEYSIGVPGPTDFVTLGAELPVVDQGDLSFAASRHDSLSE